MFITCLDLKTYLIFKLRRDNERKVHHHHFHHRTFSSPNNSYTQLLIFPFEKRLERRCGRARIYSFLLKSRIRPLNFKTEVTDAFCFILNRTETTFAKREHTLSLSVSVFFSEYVPSSLSVRVIVNVKRIRDE